MLSIETVSRDGTSTYGSATTEADIKILQTGGIPLSECWHISKKLTEGFEHFLNSHLESLTYNSTELSEEQLLVLESIVPEINVTLQSYD